MQNKQQYKTNAWLQIYTSEENRGGLIIEDFFNKKRFEIDNSIFLQILSFCVKFKSRSRIVEFVQKQFNLSTEDVKIVLNELIKNNLLITKLSPSYDAEEKTKFWKKYGWDDALDFYLSLKDYPFLDYESIQAKQVEEVLMNKYIKTDPVPPIDKKYKNVKKIFLEKDFSSMDRVDLRKLLIEKVFDYQATKDSLTKKQVSDVLFNTFGKMGTVEFQPQGEFYLKTSPSGGARHPIEAYPIIFDSEIQNGIYHYSVDENALEQIYSKANLEEIKKLIYELKTNPMFPIKMIIILSAVFPRSMWRYREPRSYRVVLHDMGHILETMKIICKAFGIKTYYGHGFHDAKLEKLLNISGVDEAVLKFVVLG